jgi:penicillin amidase
VDEEHGRYRRGDGWRPLQEIRETIAVKDGPARELVVQLTDHGPLVDHLVPPEAHPRALWPGQERGARRLALRWVGFEPSDETQCLLDLARADTVQAGREAYRGWRCPTWNIVLADAEGRIGYQCIGAIPLRGREQRGYRDPEDPADRWQGTIPFDGLPALDNPARGWVASANNQTAPPDFPYPLSGTWTPDYRAPRLESVLGSLSRHTLDDYQRLQTDVYSGRAVAGVPGLLASLAEAADPALDAAAEPLRTWDFRLDPDSRAAALWAVFLWRWDRRVVRERFAPVAPLVDGAGTGLASQLLHADPAGWLPPGGRIAAIRDTFAESVDWLRARLGDASAAWTWGALHRLGVRSPAARTPLQRELFDVPARPHQGGHGTVANAYYIASSEGDFSTRLGANYRLIADFDPALTTLVAAYPGQSGQPGSPHYADQAEPYLADRYAAVPFTRAALEQEAESWTRLLPQGE